MVQISSVTTTRTGVGLTPLQGLLTCGRLLSAGGALNYYYFDIDADGRIGASDLAATWSNLGRRLPPNPAPASLTLAAPPPPPATSALRTAPSATADLLRVGQERDYPPYRGLAH